ncbi:MAG: hypothetical protein WAU11_00865 [Ignavibacteriaceae bacterium]
MNQNNLFELETLRTELINKSFNSSSSINNLNLFVNYFETILSLNNPNLIEAFLKEFIADFITSIKKFDVWGVDPSFTNRLNVILEKLSDLDCFEVDEQTLLKELERIKNRYDKLLDILEDKEYKNGIEQKAYFPLIDNEPIENIYGVIDSITVRISKCAENNKFIIVPSEKEIEKRIIEQCENSWKVALIQLSTYIKKPFPYHDIIISFDKKIGFYEGDSLGIALTLTMLEELLRFYNPEYIIKIKECSAFTGGVKENGRVQETGKEIIKQKVKAIFFSEINTFILPKFEETYAQFALTQLKLVYPNRNLKLIPAEDISDVINRRDVVDIKKQSMIVRTGKFIKKNSLSVIITICLIMIIAYMVAIDFDKNPNTLHTDGNALFIKNKNGRIIWTTNVKITPSNLEQFAKIVDIDYDGINEVIICGFDGNKNKKDIRYTTCFSNQGEIIWCYLFTDVVKTNRENLNSDYAIKILDTLTYNSRKSLYLIATNLNSFSSAIFRIDLKTKKRLPGTYWASGHIMNCIVKSDKDKMPVIVGIGYDNGFEELVMFNFKLDTLTLVRPTTEDYLINDYTLMKFESYIRFPKTDFDLLYNNHRTPLFANGGILNEENDTSYSFATALPSNINEVEIGYYVQKNFKNVDLVIDSDFRVQRDTLVAHGKLTQPYTDTEEYKNIIKSNILYWKSGEWVKQNAIN